MAPPLLPTELGKMVTAATAKVRTMAILYCWIWAAWKIPGEQNIFTAIFFKVPCRNWPIILKRYP